MSSDFFLKSPSHKDQIGYGQDREQVADPIEDKNGFIRIDAAGAGPGGMGQTQFFQLFFNLSGPMGMPGDDDKGVFVCQGGQGRKNNFFISGMGAGQDYDFFPGRAEFQMIQDFDFRD